jgi:hypothetical protein
VITLNKYPIRLHSIHLGISIECVKIDWAHLAVLLPFCAITAFFAWLALLPYTFLAHDRGWSWSKASSISLVGAALIFLLGCALPYWSGYLVFLLLLLSAVVWVARFSVRRNKQKDIL